MAALARAGQLLAAVAGGTARPYCGDVYPGRRPPRAISLDPAYVDRMLGIHVPVPEIARSSHRWSSA